MYMYIFCENCTCHYNNYKFTVFHIQLYPLIFFVQSQRMSILDSLTPDDLKVLMATEDEVSLGSSSPGNATE